MKISPRLFISTALIVLASAIPGRAALVITEVMSASGLTGAVGNDWFELTNTGTSAIDLTGFKMDDNSNSFALSVPISFSTLGATALLAAGQSEIFLETNTAGSETEVANFRTYWGGLAATAAIATYTGSGVSLGAGAAGDEVHVFDGAGIQQAGVSFGLATTGTSFDNRAGTAAVTTLSVAGTNGAYNAANPGGQAVTDVGSPGAVPEPGAEIWIGLTALAGLGLLRARRRVA